MVNDQLQLESNEFELATFGEVLFAFSALRSTSNRRRAPRSEEILPWDEALLHAAAECESVQIRPKMPPPLPRADQMQYEKSPKPRRAAGRCTCGSCRNCTENARWERIFQEKFANADYYHHEIRVRYASPLSSV